MNSSVRAAQNVQLLTLARVVSPQVTEGSSVPPMVQSSVPLELDPDLTVDRPTPAALFVVHIVGKDLSLLERRHAQVRGVRNGLEKIADVKIGMKFSRIPIAVSEAADLRPVDQVRNGKRVVLFAPRRPRKVSGPRTCASGSRTLEALGVPQTSATSPSSATRTLVVQAISQSAFAESPSLVI